MTFKEILKAQKEELIKASSPQSSFYTTNEGEFIHCGRPNCDAETCECEKNKKIGLDAFIETLEDEEKMAIRNTFTFRPTKNVKRPGVHAKSKTSNSKNSKKIIKNLTEDKVDK